MQQSSKTVFASKGERKKLLHYSSHAREEEILQPFQPRQADWLPTQTLHPPEGLGLSLGGHARQTRPPNGASFLGLGIPVGENVVSRKPVARHIVRIDVLSRCHADLLKT